MATILHFDPATTLNHNQNGAGNAHGEKFVSIEVRDDQSRKAFLKMPRNIYQNDPNWVEPLHREVEAIFNPQVNSFYNHGITCRWILINKNNELVGRIAAFVNYEKMDNNGHRVGGIGFFECIDDEQAARSLFDVAISWLRANEITAVEGPVNFGENEKFWGLLTEGFVMPSHGMNYNPPYYKKLFEANGFKPAYEQFTNKIDLRKPLPDRFERIAQQRVLNNPDYHFEHFDIRKKEQIIDDFMTIYNKAWAHFEHFKPIDRTYVEQTLKDLKPVMEEQFVWFAYAKGKPAGFLIATPDVNPLLKFLHGKLHWFNKLKFALLRQVKGFSRVRVIIMGIVPEFQRQGLESGLILNAYRASQRKPGYREVELAWVGDFNEKMRAIHSAMGATFSKKHVTYRRQL